MKRPMMAMLLRLVGAQVAGARLVSLINADPRAALDLGARPWAGAVSLDTAAMDIVATMKGRHFRFYDQAFGKDPSYWHVASPAQQLSAAASSMLAVCSTKRPDHPCSAAHDFAARAQRIGARVEVFEQPLSHADINGELGLPGANTERVDRFIGEVLRGLEARTEQAFAPISPALVRTAAFAYRPTISSATHGKAGAMPSA